MGVSTARKQIWRNYGGKFSTTRREQAQLTGWRASARNGCNERNADCGTRVAALAGRSGSFELVSKAREGPSTLEFRRDGRHFVLSLLVHARDVVAEMLCGDVALEFHRRREQSGLDGEVGGRHVDALHELEAAKLNAQKKNISNNEQHRHASV